MTTGAKTGNVVVVECRAQPGIGGQVTIVAFCAGLQMPGMLAGCSNAVVAAAAGLADVVVVKAGSTPVVGAVAGVTFTAGLYVGGVLAGRGKTVMTG